MAAQVLALITGAAAFSIEGRPANGFVEGDVSIGFGGAISMRDVNAALSLQSMESLLGISGLRGDVVVKFEELKLVDNFPQSATGSVEVANLLVPTINRSPIGGYRAEFFTQDTGVAASIEDTDGVVDIAGSLQLAEGRSYQFVAQLAAKENAPASIRQQLQFLGSANARGQHEMRIEGQL